MSNVPEVNYTYKPGRKTDYGIGIIGAGWVVQNYHLPAYKKAGFKVVAVADKSPEVLKTMREDWGVEQTFTDYHDMLKLGEVDIVDLGIQTFGRVAVVGDVADAGKHMLVQKPFARSYHEAAEMVHAAESAGVKIAVNSHYRWIPAFRGAWSLLRQGCIGDPFLVMTQMWGNQDDYYFHTLPERRWNAEITDFMQIEWAAHHFDYLRFWAGCDPSSIYYSGTRSPLQNFKGEMICNYSVEFPGMLRAYFVFNQTNKAGEGIFNFRIEGTEGVIRGETPDRLYLKRYDEDSWIEWHLPTDLRPGLPDTYVATMGDLMDAITEGREHVSSGRDNMSTVRAYMAGVLSQREHRPVSPEEIKEDGDL
ncbi:MAG: Gfo/Idh/MocA family protein [Armatimonadota bacterium]